MIKQLDECQRSTKIQVSCFSCEYFKMIHVDVRTNVKSVQKNLGFLARKQLPKATSMALNKTATSLRGFTVREGKKAMGASNIKSKEVRAKTFILKANIRKLFAVLILRGGKYPLERFRAKQTSIGVTASAYGVNRVYKSTFIQTVRGKRNVFKRINKRKALPIKQLWGTGLLDTFKRKKKFKNLVMRKASKQFNIELIRALKAIAMRPAKR